MYGLRNPAFTDDVRMAMFDKQFPVLIDDITGNLIPESKINNGNPQKDEFDKGDKKEEKKTPLWAKILIGGAIVGATVLACWKIKPVANFLKNMYTKIKTKFFNSP